MNINYDRMNKSGIIDSCDFVRDVGHKLSLFKNNEYSMFHVISKEEDNYTEFGIHEDKGDDALINIFDAVEKRRNEKR